jgi:UDP-2-acetamido-2,6-beta-L-arabino-hexul-4-ose reductase
LIAGVEVRPLAKKFDQRGWLLKMLMLGEIEGETKFGEIYVTVAQPGAVKGVHYHEHCTEWFCVIQGKGKLVLLDRQTQERCEIEMSEDHPVRVRVPPQIVHGVRNTGNEPMYLLAYADKPYDAAQPDTVAFDLDCG